MAIYSQTIRVISSFHVLNISGTSFFGINYGYLRMGVKP
jgi:hypothetical protein